MEQQIAQQQGMSPEEQAMMQQQMMAQQGQQPMMACGGRLHANGGKLYAEGGEMTPEEAQAMQEQMMQQQMMQQQAQQEMPQVEEEQTQEPSQEESSNPFADIEDPEELSTAELNSTIDEIINYARTNKLKTLVKEGRKAKRSSREVKEDFVSDALDEIQEYEEEQAQNEENQPSPKEEMKAQEQMQQEAAMQEQNPMEQNPQAQEMPSNTSAAGAELQVMEQQMPEEANAFSAGGQMNIQQYQALFQQIAQKAAQIRNENPILYNTVSQIENQQQMIQFVDQYLAQQEAARLQKERPAQVFPQQIDELNQFANGGYSLQQEDLLVCLPNPKHQHMHHHNFQLLNYILLMLPLNLDKEYS